MRFNLHRATIVTAMVLAACTLRVSAQLPAYRLDAPLPPGSRAQVLILATDHLSMLGDAYRPATLAGLIDALDRFAPDAIAVENLPSTEIERLVAAAAQEPNGTAGQMVAAFAAGDARHGKDMQTVLGLSARAAATSAHERMARVAGDDAGSRRTTVAELVAAYDVPSAVLQWSYLPKEGRGPGGSISVGVADFLNRRLASADESVSIAATLARRRGLHALASVDDHVDDELGSSTGLYRALEQELPANPAYVAFAASPYMKQAQSRLSEAAASSDLLPFYLRINSQELLDQDVAGQWHLFFRTRLESHRDRARVALWEARNLNIAGNIRSAMADKPAGRMLVVVGTAHKPFLDRYLGQMMDVEVVQLRDYMAR